MAYITGSSRGIGNALALKLLSEGYRVIGLSRSSTISHKNFSHIQLDLNNLEHVKAFEFKENGTSVILINNAGTIGEIEPIGSITDQSIQDVMLVNTIAPQLLMNKFIRKYKNECQNGHILNISSGAGKKPIDAWASYCASKAALDLFSETISTEFQTREIKNWHIHSVAPGVVDTQMQVEIRNANPDAFHALDKFIALKKDGGLTNPISVAEKLYKVINTPNKFPSTILSVRNF